MKIKKKQFKELKEIVDSVNNIVPGTGIRLNKLISEIESIQKISTKTVKEKPLKEGDLCNCDFSKYIGDVGYFWTDSRKGVFYGRLRQIDDTGLFIATNSTERFFYFSKTPPELK